MKKVHWIFSGLSLVIILLSLNRLTPFTADYLQPFEFLRWLDFNAMIPIPLLSVVLYFLLKREVVYDSAFRKSLTYTVLSALFIVGVYFFGAGSGTHEVTNYLNSRFCLGEATSSLCNIISYNDDIFSHYVYYIGFLLLNVSLILMEFSMPRKTDMRRIDLALICVNALFIAFGIFANLAFEEIGFDLYFFAVVMLLTHWILIWGRKPFSLLPVTFYFAVAYTLGVIGTIFYKINS